MLVLFYPPGTGGISLGVEGNVCSIYVLLKKVIGQPDSNIEGPGMSSFFYPYIVVTSDSSLLDNVAIF